MSFSVKKKRQAVSVNRSMCIKLSMISNIQESFTREEKGRKSGKLSMERNKEKWGEKKRQKKNRNKRKKIEKWLAKRKAGNKHYIFG